MTIKDLLKRYSITQTELSKRFGIPLRTVQHWCAEGSEHRDCPPYVVNMIDKLLSE